jgi:hypothetical protein
MVTKLQSSNISINIEQQTTQPITKAHGPNSHISENKPETSPSSSMKHNYE